MLSQYSRELEAKLPPANPETKTKVQADTLCQVIDIFDIETSISVQLERLEAKKHSVELVPEEDEQGQEVPGSKTKLSKYTLCDNHGNHLFLIFHANPREIPQNGQFVVIKKGCELRRGILVAAPSAIKLLDRKGEVTHQNRINVLKEMLEQV